MIPWTRMLTVSRQKWSISENALKSRDKVFLRFRMLDVREGSSKGDSRALA